LHLAGSENIPIYRERKKGYLEAMHEAGIDVPPSWIIEESLILEGGNRAYHKAMKHSLRPDAFFCAGDYAALGVLQAAKKQGIHIPQQLGITGFANEPFTAFLEPGLTTVDQRGEEMGKQVAEMYLGCGEGEAPMNDCEKIVLEPELIVRESSRLQK
jgi:LacI family transcriptional regulator